ncbi:molecular chaperone DnaJ [Georgenia sp. Z1491]|uniref:molecular chaperone DnaJ n=1 Tax=Georgenia sp. Z1491 TaxID=3416707 RepID=UPI003CF4BECF
MSDYYSILGVSRDASPDEIKRAYRKRARQLHPDVAGPEAGDQFKDVQRAYDVLRDQDKRRMYDAGGEDALRGGGAGAGAAGFGDFADIFSQFFGGAAGGGMRGPVPRARRGRDSQIVLDIDLVDAVFGSTEEIPVQTAIVCGTCNGTCCRPGTSPTTCTTCGGQGSVQRVTRSFLGQMMATSVCPACSGHGTVIPEPCQECAGEGRVRSHRTISVEVPAGVSTGTQLRLQGEGEVGPAGGPPGDLFVEMRERPHPVFQRHGDDLLCTLTIPMTAAALGTLASIETLDGPRDIDVVPGTQPGERITLEGLGVGRLRARGRRGDLHVDVEVTVPTKLDDEQRELLSNLASARGEERPEARLTSADSSMFSRLRERFVGR